MIRLVRTLAARGSSGLASALKQELERLDAGDLPLQQGLTRGSQVADDPISAMVIRIEEVPEGIRAKVGIFYSGILAGCSCADDPTPIDTHPEYCELQVDIDGASGEARIALLPG